MIGLRAGGGRVQGSAQKPKPPSLHPPSTIIGGVPVAKREHGLMGDKVVVENETGDGDLVPSFARGSPLPWLHVCAAERKGAEVKGAESIV